MTQHSEMRREKILLCVTTSNSKGECVDLGNDILKILAGFSGQLEQIKHRAESKANRTPPRFVSYTQIRIDSDSPNRN